jgi:hypothetical protein
MDERFPFAVFDELISMCDVYVVRYLYWVDGEECEDGVTIIATSWDDAMRDASILAKIHGLETWGGDRYEIISAAKVSIGTLNVASIEDTPFSKWLVSEMIKLYENHQIGLALAGEPPP